jgi:hypothetical protein
MSLREWILGNVIFSNIRLTNHNCPFNVIGFGLMPTFTGPALWRSFSSRRCGYIKKYCCKKSDLPIRFGNFERGSEGCGS